MAARTSPSPPKSETSTRAKRSVTRVSAARLRHRLQLVGGEAGIGAGQCAAHGGLEATWVAGGLDEKGVFVETGGQGEPLGQRQPEGPVDFAVVRIGDGLGVGCDADDCHPGARAVEPAQFHALADRILAGPVAAGVGLINDADGSGVAAIGVGEVASMQQRLSGRGEIPRHGGADVAEVKASRLGRGCALRVVAEELAGGVEGWGSVTVAERTPGRARSSPSVRSITCKRDAAVGNNRAGIVRLKVRRCSVAKPQGSCTRRVK